MKKYTISLLIILTAMAGYGQNHLLRNTNFSHPIITNKSSVLLSTDKEKIAALQNIGIEHAFIAKDPIPDGPDQCDKYHRLKYAGILMTAGGGGVMAIGMALVFIATDDASYYGVNTPADQQKVAGGSVMIAIGAGSLIAGATLMDIYGKKGKKYCGDKDSYRRSYRRRYAYMQVQPTSNGLTINF